MRAKGRGVCPSCNGRHMAQTAAHLADHVIPPVPVRQWVISVPKRLRGFLADRPRAVAALTKIFLDEVERLLCAAAGVTRDANALASARPRLGGISFLHRFGSALNHHVHLHACVTDEVFVPPAAEAGCDTPPAFLPARPIMQADLAALTERVRRRGSTGIGITGCLRRITSCEKPLRRSPSATSASGATPLPAGMGATVTPREAAVTRLKSPARTTPLGLPGRNSWPGWGRRFRSSARTAASTFG